MSTPRPASGGRQHPAGPRTGPRHRRIGGRRARVVHLLRSVALWGLAVLFLLPFYVIVRNAFSDNATIISPNWQWIPRSIDFSVLPAMFADKNLAMASSLGHSAIMALLQTTLTVLIALVAGYGLARLNNTVGRVLLAITLFTLMVPATVTFLPMFVITAQLGWIDSYRGLVVPTIFSAFATYLFRQAFLGFPIELEEAAAIDGANPWSTFWRIVVPNNGGIIGAVGTITFIGSWNAFLWPLLVARDNTKTVQLALSQFMTSQGVKYPELFAGALVAITPVVVVFLVLQRYLVQGVTASGLK